MRRLLALFCASTLLVGCTRAPDPTAAEPERSAEAASIASSSTEVVEDDLVDVTVGGFSAKVPSTWTIDENGNYIMPEDRGYSVVSCDVHDSKPMNDVFVNSETENKFINSFNDIFFDGSGACSEMTHDEIGGIEERHFNMVGQIDGVTYSYLFYLFDNPGGGILLSILGMTTAENVGDIIHDFHRFLLTFEPNEEAAVAPGASFEYSGPHLYDNAIVKDVMSGDRSQKLGEYSVSFASSGDCTDEALADWYLNYVKAHDFNYALIVYTDDEGYGIFETYGSIEIGDKIAQDKYGDYYTTDNSDARFIVIEEDGTVTDITE